MSVGVGAGMSMSMSMSMGMGMDVGMSMSMGMDLFTSVEYGVIVYGLHGWFLSLFLLILTFAVGDNTKSVLVM